MMMSITDFTGFPAPTVVSQSKSNPKFGFKAGFKVLFAQCGAKRPKSMCVWNCLNMENTEKPDKDIIQDTTDKRVPVCVR